MTARYSGLQEELASKNRVSGIRKFSGFLWQLKVEYLPIWLEPLGDIIANLFA